MRATASPLKRLCICLIVTCLAACSLARLGYSNGETITYWWLNGYVGFNSDQRPWVRQRIDNMFVWHRRTQLRDYVQILADMQGHLQHEVSKAGVLADYDVLTECGGRIFDQAAPDLADLALSMDADNLNHLAKKFASNNDGFRKDYLRGDPQERQEFRYKKVIELVEYWFGDLSEAQEAAIRRVSDQRPLNNEMWMADRLQRQQTLIALLKRIQLEKPSRVAVIGMLKAYVGNNNLVRSSAGLEMKAFLEASKDSLAQLAVVIVSIATPKQKAHAVAKLQQWMDDFNALADKT